jgi:hypothetical protein
VATQLNMRNIGFEFGTAFSGTGDHINYIPSGTNTGLITSNWENVAFYGHDGSHYAVNLVNPLYGLYSNVYSYGGGGLKVVGSGVTNYGNMVWDQLYINVVTGGTAHGVDLSATVTQKLNLCTFLRPQSMVTDHSGVSTGNKPTSAQYIWKEDSNVTNIVKVGCDFETNVSSKVQLSPPVNGNPFDFSSMFSDAAALESPAWGHYGRVYNGQGQGARTFVDTSSSGTVAENAAYYFPGPTFQASSATTYSVAATLWVTAPTAGTNATFTKVRAIYATGAIETTSSMTCASLTAVGTTNINVAGGGGGTQIGSGSQTVGIGVASGTASLKVAAASASRASLNLVSSAGVAPSAPADGDMWYDGTNLNFRVGGTTKTVTLA